MQVVEEYARVEVCVLLALCKASVRQMFVRCGFYEKFDPNRVFLTVHDAVLVALDSSPDLLHALLLDSPVFQFDPAALSNEAGISITPCSFHSML